MVCQRDGSSLGLALRRRPACVECGALTSGPRRLLVWPCSLTESDPKRADRLLNSEPLVECEGAQRLADANEPGTVLVDRRPLDLAVHPQVAADATADALTD
jgi:hypothetical protein